MKIKNCKKKFYFQKAEAEKFKQGNIHKAVRKNNKYKVLDGRFSKSTIDAMFKKDRKKFKNPPESDLCFAMKLRISCKINALNQVRSDIPCPELYSLQEKFGWLYVIPGEVKAAIAYHKLKVPKMKPVEEISSACYDEINFDQKYDLEEI